MTTGIMTTVQFEKTQKLKRSPFEVKSEKGFAIIKRKAGGTIVKVEYANTMDEAMEIKKRIDF